MRIWLAGSKSFGAAVLEVFGDQVVGVTAPVGRGKADALAHAAMDRGLLVWTTVTPEMIQLNQVDCIVSAHNLAYISDKARHACNHGAIGYHPSLLPRWRGHKAVEATIAAQDPIAGGTVYKLDDGWDTGPILKQDWTHVRPEWSASNLWRESLFPMGLRLLKEVLSTDARDWTFSIQDDSLVKTCAEVVA